MRRGLMSWNADELPESVLADRIRRLRTEMAEAGLEAMLAYTNLTRPAAANYLSGFTPYWSEGILMVPRKGEILLSNALSKRVAGWIRTTMPRGDIQNSPRPGKLIGGKIAQTGLSGNVGIVELGTLPIGHFTDLVEAAPNVGFVDASAVFARARGVLDDAERTLLKRAAQIAERALATVSPDRQRTIGEVIAAAEYRARSVGAEECYITVRPNLAGSRAFLRTSLSNPIADDFAVRASIAYKGAWIRKTRSYSGNTDRASLCAEIESKFLAYCRTLSAKAPIDQLALACTLADLGGNLEVFEEECPVGTYPLRLRSTLQAGIAPYTIINVELTYQGIPWSGSALILSAD